MDAHTLYRLRGPTAWAGAPEHFSFSSLKRMSTCLRQWQLARSRYEDLPAYPDRPSEAAEVGSIVHDLVSRLFRATAMAGYPPIGSDAFRTAVAQANILGRAREQLDAFAQRASSSPRALGFRLQSTPRDVYNKVAAAFRSEYEKVVAQAFTPIPPLDPESQSTDASADDPFARRALLERLGVLSEEPVRHPTLPLLGYIDLLVRRNGQTTVLDFKTGAPRPEYHEQLLLYALMWWRSTGDQPAAIELRYGARVEPQPLSEALLLAAEERARDKIDRFRAALTATPAASTVGPHCAGCSVRQICGDYWESQPARSGEWVDLEGVVAGAGSRTGFFAHDAKGKELTVVFEEDVWLSSGPFVVGERLQILGARREPEADTFRMTKATETFRVR